ncbi:MAG: hypothetical protein HC763_23065 [Hydrococcus sp. CRU_1_1]|nr:hypothetical protein [Hydrococcus sp. CRU_1_1]
MGIGEWGLGIGKISTLSTLSSRVPFVRILSTSDFLKKGTHSPVTAS